MKFAWPVQLQVVEVACNDCQGLGTIDYDDTDKIPAWGSMCANCGRTGRIEVGRWCRLCDDSHSATNLVLCNEEVEVREIYRVTGTVSETRRRFNGDKHTGAEFGVKDMLDSPRERINMIPGELPLDTELVLVIYQRDGSEQAPER